MQSDPLGRFVPQETNGHHIYVIPLSLPFQFLSNMNCKACLSNEDKAKKKKKKKIDREITFKFAQFLVRN